MDVFGMSAASTDFGSAPKVMVSGTTLYVIGADVPDSERLTKLNLKREKDDVLITNRLREVGGPAEKRAFDLRELGFDAETAPKARVYWVEPDATRTLLERVEQALPAGVVEAEGETKVNRGVVVVEADDFARRVDDILTRAGGALPGEADLAVLERVIWPYSGAAALPDGLDTVAESAVKRANGAVLKWLGTKNYDGEARTRMLVWKARFGTAHPEVFFSDGLYGPWLEDVLLETEIAFRTREEATEHLKSVDAYALSAVGGLRERAMRWGDAVRRNYNEAARAQGRAQLAPR